VVGRYALRVRAFVEEGAPPSCLRGKERWYDMWRTLQHKVRSGFM
jgi:hypothetical protein